MKYTLKELIKETGKEIAESMPVTIATRVAEVVSFPWLVLTTTRRIENHCKKANPLPRDYNEAITRYLAPIIIATIGEFIAGVALYKSEKIPAEYFAILVATNIASWVYEKARTAKQNLEEKAEGGQKNVL